MAVFLLSVSLVLLAVVYYYFNNIRKKFNINYYKERGIPQIDKIFFPSERRSNSETFLKHYWQLKNMGVKHGGVYGDSFSTQKFWVPIHPELVKAVLIKDFTSFSAHNPRYPGLFFNNLFHMDGEEWKDMRRKLTPTFTTGKMKMMFDIIANKIHGLVDLVEEVSKTGKPTEIKYLLARFTTDVIGSCGFGIECSSLQDENSEFFKQGQGHLKIAARPPPSLFKIILMVLGIVKPKMPDFSDIETFFRGVVEETLRYREQNKIIRKDFLHLMIQLKNKGTITELVNDDEDIYNKTVKNDGISFEDIAGECILFFNAGFETTSTTMSFALLELTQNQDVQKKVREEVREVLKRHGGKLSYEAVQEMAYTECVIRETLRKYPPLGVITRMCTKNYTIPGTNSVIEKGTSVNIPGWGLHMDPEYFPNPEKFIPERFSEKNKSNIQDITYIPFGEGPRMCLGLRFGIMQSKAGIASLVSRYNFTLNPRTSYPPKFDKNSFITAVDGGVWVNAEKVN